jgi:hypothetical protein
MLRMLRVKSGALPLTLTRRSLGYFDLDYDFCEALSRLRIALDKYQMLG